MCDTLDPQLKVRLFGTEEDIYVDKSTSTHQPMDLLDRKDNETHKLHRDQRTDQCYSKYSSFFHSKRRNVNFSHKFKFINFHFLLVLVLIFNPTADACSSRSTPKPRPPSQSAIRPNITFQTYACPPTYAAWYCLNGATCFTVKIADSILYNCECADGFMGQRCEFKDLDGSYLPTRERLIQLKNSPLGQALLLVVTVVISIAIISAILTKWRLSKRLNNNNVDLNDLDSREMNPSYIMSTGPSSFPFTISSHCDVIRGYNMESSVIQSNDSRSSSSPSFNYRYPNSMSLATESRQRAYNNFSM